MLRKKKFVLYLYVDVKTQNLELLLLPQKRFQKDKATDLLHVEKVHLAQKSEKVSKDAEQDWS